ncbi:hypothetical protein TanjilG_20840 [Lupinus angustifolius]|uniref:TF-B3 domain-containing protein n=1 Tax=Lupinus angustifolius TaxID=3871 RepID=A0A4P1QRX1_LUPAN|nr:hypothetical protein TanjilG_20840 [Lupinus angustifolius]
MFGPSTIFNYESLFGCNIFCLVTLFLISFYLYQSSIQPLPKSFSFQNRLLSERLGDLSAKGWNQLGGSGPVQPWKQVPSPFNSISSPNLHPDVSSIVDLSHNFDKMYGNEKLPFTSMEKKNKDLSGTSSWSATLGSREMMLMNGMRNEDKSSSCLNICQQLPSLKEDSALRPFGLSVPYASPNERNSQVGATKSHPQQSPPSCPGKQFSGTSHLPLDTSGETQAHNGWPHVDTLGRNQLFPQYWPRCTELELQQLSIDDAGRNGRLVLPKNCAEAYFPPISQPEGLPLKILDTKGKEWVFQFRFWPNNNSRMYVLEGVTPCIQSMQLQAGDTVTFNRLEPEGRLVMGFRKSSSATPSDQTSALGFDLMWTRKGRCMQLLIKQGEEFGAHWVGITLAKALGHTNSDSAASVRITRSRTKLGLAASVRNTQACCIRQGQHGHDGHFGPSDFTKMAR